MTVKYDCKQETWRSDVLASIENSIVDTKFLIYMSSEPNPVNTKKAHRMLGHLMSAKTIIDQIIENSTPEL